mmetsp:Transcript_171181/g.548734  ORF Transcript_171181/g.548734 Transcript_171181/m.548734 type:complete len:529 (+) Transcript_171181:18-1604(+)
MGAMDGPSAPTNPSPHEPTSDIAGLEDVESGPRRADADAGQLWVKSQLFDVLLAHMQEEKLRREVAFTRSLLMTFRAIVLHCHVPHRDGVVFRGDCQDRLIRRMPIHRGDGFPVPLEVGHGSSTSISRVPDLEPTVVGSRNEQLAYTRAPTDDVDIAGVCILDVHRRFLAILLAHIPDPHASVRTARGEDVLAVGARPPPLHVFHGGSMCRKRLFSAHIPTARHRLPEVNRTIVAARQELAGFMGAEVQREALFLVRLTRVYGLHDSGDPLPRRIQCLPVRLQIPHVDLAGVRPTRDDVGRLRHGPHSVHTSGMGGTLVLQLGLVLVLLLLLAGLLVLVVAVLLAVFQGLVQLRPLHHVQAVVYDLLGLRAGHHVGSHRVVCSLGPQIVPKDIETEAGPLHLGSVQHVIGPGLLFQLLAFLELIDARPPDLLRRRLRLLVLLLFFLLVSVDDVLFFGILLQIVVFPLLICRHGRLLRLLLLLLLLVGAAGLGRLLPPLHGARHLEEAECRGRGTLEASARDVVWPALG